MISTTHTLDGVKVEPGLRVWDYDLKPRIVGERTDAYKVELGLPPDDDPWYNMIISEGEFKGQQGSPMNCSRMWVRHPATNKRA